MTFSTLRALGLAVTFLIAGPALAQTTYYTVTSSADDGNARDKNVGDGVCEDSFTDANPSAEPRCSLRAAIDEANATAGEVVINVPGQLPGGQSGTYTLTRVAPNDAGNTYEDANAFGDLDISAEPAFSTLTIRGTGTPGPTVAIGPNDRVLHIQAGTVRVERMTITGGTARAGDNGVSAPGTGESVDGQDGDDGGCLLIAEGATVTLDQLSVNNCSTQSGGNGAAPAASGTAGGAAGNGGNGGGIANFGTLTLRRSFVAQNGTGDAGSAGNGAAGSGQAVAGGNGGNGGLGGGVFNAGTLTVEQSTITGNTGGDPSAGAAGTNGGSSGADGEGGAGGGIATIEGGTVALAGTIVAANSAGDDVNNPETEGGPEATKQPGSDLYDGTPADDDTVSPGFTAYTPGTFTDGGFNLIGTNNSVEEAFPAGTLVGTGQGDAATRVDPVITGSNRDETYAVTAYELGAGSPAIDAGDPAIGQDTPAVDGRGFLRPGTASGDQTADIGAFEFMSRPAADEVLISELDAVTGDPDSREFVELKNIGDTAVQLADYVVVFFDGANDKAYASFNLQGELAAGGTFVFGNPDVSGTIQTFGGSESDIVDAQGAVALYRGKASDYPTGAVAGQNQDTRADVVVYDNSGSTQRRDAGSLADAFGVPSDQIATGDDANNSVQRNPDGTYSPGTPSPGQSSVNAEETAPGAFELSAPQPNPTGTVARLQLSLDAAQSVRVELFDTLGRLVTTLHDGAASNDLTVSVDAASLAPGVYVVRAVGERSSATRQLTVVR